MTVSTFRLRRRALRQERWFKPQFLVRTAIAWSISSCRRCASGTILAMARPWRTAAFTRGTILLPTEPLWYT